MKSQLHDVNLRNLRIWSSVGSDVENGLWAIYGTRMAWAQMCDPTYDFSKIRDYDWFNEFWDQLIGDLPADPVDRLNGLPFFIHVLGEDIKAKTKIAVPLLDNDTSEFFRETFKLRND
jgi:hypothetical protein